MCDYAFLLEVVDLCPSLGILCGILGSPVGMPFAVTHIGKTNRQQCYEAYKEQGGVFENRFHQAGDYFPKILSNSLLV